MKIYYRLIIFLLLLGLSSLLSITGNEIDVNNNEISAFKRDQIVNILRDALESEHSWARIRAAEYLIALDYPQGVTQAMKLGLKNAEKDSACIVAAWMVIAKASFHEERDRWTGKILSLFNDPNSGYTDYAAAALFVLEYQFTEIEKPNIRMF